MNKKQTILSLLLLAALPVAAQKLTSTKTTVDAGKTGYMQPITAIFEVGLRMAVQNYEEKNGPVRAYKNKKKDVGDVFDL